MKLPTPILRPITQFSPKFRKFHTSQTASTNEVLNIINTVNPMEVALETIVRFLSPDTVCSVLREQPNPELGFRFFVWAVKRKRFCSSVSYDWVVSYQGQ